MTYARADAEVVGKKQERETQVVRDTVKVAISSYCMVRPDNKNITAYLNYMIPRRTRTLIYKIISVLVSQRYYHN